MFPKINLMKIFYEESGAGGAGTSSDNQSDNQSESESAPDFETWLSKAPDELKTTIEPLFKAHVEKLMTTVKDTRKERDTFQKELRDAIKKLDATSDEAKKFEGIADKLDEANKKAEFYEEAPTNGCRNLKAAFALVKSEDLYTKHGAVDWKQLKEIAPEFFGEKSRLPVKKSAGNGTDSDVPSSHSMNDWIRKQARN